MDADDPFGYINYSRGEPAAVGSATLQPDGYASPGHYQVRHAPSMAGLGMVVNDNYMSMQQRVSTRAVGHTGPDVRPCHAKTLTASPVFVHVLQAHSPVARGSEDGSGTPKAPLLPFEGRPGRPCPGAPKKGRAPFSHFDVSIAPAVSNRLPFRCQAT
jgi:hypothetical protein